MKPHLFSSGLTELAHQLSGRERIYLGARPYGFHLGNQITLLAYPKQLCEEVLRRGITPRFTFYLFLNDYEQFQLSGVNKESLPFNVYPKHTTLQYTYPKHHTNKSVVEFWAPILEREVRLALSEYSEVNVIVVRNSEMCSLAVFQKLLLETIANPDVIGTILSNTSKRSVDTASCVFALGICPTCKWARGIPRIRSSKSLTLHCSQCCSEHTEEIGRFDYWFYHKPLALPRLKIFDIDLCITGVDHLEEGDFISRKKLIDAFDPSIRMPEMLFAPKLVSETGEKISKKNGNTYTLPFDSVLRLTAQCDDSVIKIPVLKNELRPLEPLVESIY